MRIAIVTQTRALVGGVETYLEQVIAGLASRHTVAFWSASADTGDRGVMALPDHVAAWPGAASHGETVTALRHFNPGVVFTHGLDDPALEVDMLRVAPVVAMQHNYRGACVSGTKTLSWPGVRACDRTLGPACLALYFPRRCGGLNPLTMGRLYGVQTARLANLKGCAAVVTLSAHMRDEMLRQGLSASRVHVVPPFVEQRQWPAPVVRRSDEPVHLLFLGRLEPLKGLARLLDALPRVAATLNRAVILTVAGDGADRLGLEAHARWVTAGTAQVRVTFVGWQGREGRGRLFSDAQALVVPSIWPEPFGVVGLEAGVAGVPAVAFATGGIGDWLKDEQTGCLAPAAGARPTALAEAIVRCVRDPESQVRLARGAQAFAMRWTLERHLTALERVMAEAAQAPRPGEDV